MNDTRVDEIIHASELHVGDHLVDITDEGRLDRLITQLDQLADAGIRDRQTTRIARRAPGARADAARRAWERFGAR